MRKQRFALMLLMQLGLVCAGGLHAQVQTLVPAVVPGAKPAKVEQITVHGTSLEGNLEGDAVDRPVVVYLPPSYSTSIEMPLYFIMPTHAPGTAPAVGDAKVAILLVDTEQRSRRFKTAFAPNS